MSENTPPMSRRDALTGLASASAVLLAGCDAFPSSSPDDEPAERPTQTVMTTTPRQPPGGGEFASTEPSATDTPSNTATSHETPASTSIPTLTPTETPTATSETDSCGLEFSEDVMNQARSVGLEARKAVVWLYHNKAGKQEIMGGIGTGWFIGKSHIVTNGHIVDGNRRQDGSFRAVTINNTHHELEVVDYVYKESPVRDIALLRVKNGSAPHTLTPGDTSTLTETQPIVQVGHPATIGAWLIALGEHIGWSGAEDGRSLTSEIPAFSGNSGSPQLTLDGTVIGMHWGQSSVGGGPGAPEPIDEQASDANVYTELPYQTRREQMAEPIEQIQDRIDTWRS